MKKKLGYLEVIAGPMYCGKTEELIRSSFPSSTLPSSRPGAGSVGKNKKSPT